MTRVIEFKAKDRHTKQWITGDVQHISDVIVLVNKDGSHEIEESTLSENTGTACYGDRPVFEHDLVFEEVEHEYGDERMYYVVTYIIEWGRFALLDYYEYNDYVLNGIEYYAEEEAMYSMIGIEQMHYAGNYFDNKDVLINAVGGNDISLTLN